MNNESYNESNNENNNSIGRVIGFISKLFIAIIIPCLIMIVVAKAQGKNYTDEVRVTDEATNTTISKIPNYSDNFISANVYDYVDPETGVHYLIFRDNHPNGMGGITPRLNSDGTIMVDITHSN